MRARGVTATARRMSSCNRSAPRPGGRRGVVTGGRHTAGTGGCSVNARDLLTTVPGGGHAADARRPLCRQCPEAEVDTGGRHHDVQRRFLLASL